ncbi:MAG: S-layer homology domain-containing protein [Clostridia bacterium]|nr:S-layer homology domain-containing protein [Clostridia bacterium]MDH7574092.1 S-layer homology domain-containing protein [Clostridia bacterium]
MIRFYASDGYYMTLTVQELLRDRRYRFPNFKSGGGDGDGHIPGDPSGAVEVETIIGLVSAEGTDDPSYMDDSNTPMLMLGQRAVTEQTGPLFVKYVNKIEVLTSAIPKWDAPRADPPGGTVPAGTLVRLSNNNMDIDKIHYTTDGSTPDLNSPIYNWIARRWWSARGEQTVAEINHPIEITKDTVIKAVTIGPGKLDSEVVTFTYKVTGTQTSQTDAVSPGEGGTVSLGDEAVIEIPAGALAGSNPVEVRIDRVEAPPAAPAGLKLVGGVYEFTVDGKPNYSFKKPVTIKLKFDRDEAGSEAPAIHYYDETEKKWVNIGGRVTDDFISVQTDHFTKFAVMVALPASVTAKINPGEGGTVSLGDEAAIEIPAGALAGTGPVEVKIEKVNAPPAPPAGYRLVGGVYEFTVDGKPSYSFAKKVTIRLSLDPGALGEGEAPSVHRYDQDAGRWVNLGGEVRGNTVSVEVDHLSKYAVMAEAKSPAPVFSDTAGHWAENSIRELVVLGAIGGYPDGTFRPDNQITRAEFASVLVRALKLEPAPGKTFADTAGHWAQASVATAVYHGLVAGYDADTFGPDDPITREQMAAMTVRAARLSPVAAGMPFRDAGSTSGWAREAVATAVQNGIISGYPDNTLRPQGHATRAEAVTVVLKVLKALGRPGQGG